MIDVKNITKKQIQDVVRKIWDDMKPENAKYGEYYAPSDVSVSKISSEGIRIDVSCMYRSVTFNARHIIELTEAFQTANIDSDEINLEGCETCDHGSSYGFELYIRPDTKWSSIKGKVRDYFNKESDND